MAKRNIKETLLSTLVHGEETLNNIDVLRNLNRDLVSSIPTDSPCKRIHPSELHLVVNEIIDTHQGAKILRFVSESGYLPPFQAGQYINIVFDIDGARATRPYSLSSSPQGKRVLRNYGGRNQRRLRKRLCFEPCSSRGPLPF